MVDNIIYNAKFPNPPTFYNAPSKESFQVPKYYGFDHPCTKWILGSIVSNQALLRLLKVASFHRAVMKRYHQIPDRPNLIMKDKYNTDRAAFNPQAILYLTPLSLAVYMKYDDALAQLVSLKGADGNTAVDPNDICFVQNFWRKGESRYFTDLITTSPAIIAIRRNYIDAFPYLLLAGYRPNSSFSLTYRKPHREIVIVYKDLIDYVIDYLKSRPAFNVGRLMRLLLQSTKDCSNILDIFCFDIMLNGEPNIVSLFLRVSRMALEMENISEENGMHCINVLEKLHEAGFFHGLPKIVTEANKNNIKTLENILKEKTDQKIGLKDIQSLKDEEKNAIVEKDYRHCVASIIMWLRSRSLKRKTEQNIHLLNLLTKILFDTNYIKIFFESETKSLEELCRKIDEFPNLAGKIDQKTVIVIRDHIFHVFCQSEQMIIEFISRYKIEPKNAFFGCKEVLDLQHSSKHNWVKSEMADASFRHKYLQDKEKQLKVASNENMSNIFNCNELQYLQNCREKSEKEISQNQNHGESKRSRNEYFYVSTKSRKFRSSSTDHYCKKSQIVDDNSPDVTIKSFESFDSKDLSETFSIFSTDKVDHLTMIEIDMAIEVKQSKTLYTEVVINDEEDRKDFKLQNVSIIPNLFNCYKSSRKPPPLTDRKEKISK